MWISKNGFQGIRHSQILLSYHIFSEAVMRVADRERKHRLHNHTILHSFKRRVSTQLKILATSPCNKAREQQLPWLHPYMVGAAAGSQTNTGFTWFLPAQTDKSGGISEWEALPHASGQANTWTSSICNCLCYCICSISMSGKRSLSLSFPVLNVFICTTVGTFLATKHLKWWTLLWLLIEFPQSLRSKVTIRPQRKLSNVDRKRVKVSLGF